MSNICTVSNRARCGVRVSRATLITNMLKVCSQLVSILSLQSLLVPLFLWYFLFFWCSNLSFSNIQEGLNSLLFVATHAPALDVYLLSPLPHKTFQKKMSFPLNFHEIPSSLCCNNLGTSNSLYIVLGTREGAVLR